MWGGLLGSGGCEKSVSVNELGTLSRRPDPAEYRRSLLDPDSGGSSMGEGPLCGERPDTEEVSESNDGVPTSAESWEKADGDGKGVSM